MTKSNISTTKRSQYALWIQGGDSSLRNVKYYNMVLDMVTSNSELTHVQIDQILSISILRGTPEVFVTKGHFKAIKKLCDMLQLQGVECSFKAHYKK